MKKFGFASLVAGSMMAAIVGFAGPAQAAVNSVVPDPVGPHYSVDNHDTVDTSNGFVDRPF